MMNFVALSLIATSLVVSGLFSPNPQNNAAKEEEVIVKGGHRAVVVEYGDDIGDGNTKVSISSQHPTKGPLDDQLSRAAASIAGVSQDVKGKGEEVMTGLNGPHGARPRELICDAYGKCKHKISEVWSKAKGKASEAEEAVEEVVEEVVDKAKGLASKAEEGAESVKDNAKEKVKEAGKAAERVKEKVRETGEMAREKGEEVKGKTGEKVRETGEKARESVDKVKEKTEEMVEETGEKIKKRKKELSDIGRRGKEVVFDVLSVGYNVLKETLGSMMNVMQLLGFAIAYGISVWVTFIMSHVLAGVLPRQQFGMVQSKIYPVYFKAMMGSIGLALLGHLFGQRGQVFRSKADMLQGYNLLSSLLFVLCNLLFLEPRATKVMFNRMKLEKEEGRGRDRATAPTRVMDTVVGDSAGPIPTTTATPTTTTAAATTTDTTTVPTTTTTTSVGKSKDEAKSRLSKFDNRLKKLNSYSSFLNILTLMGLTWHLVYLSQRLRATCK